MTRSPSNIHAGINARNVAGRQPQPQPPSSMLRRLPLASAISAILAGGMSGVRTPPTADSDTNTLEEVVVTAQKKR